MNLKEEIVSILTPPYHGEKPKDWETYWNKEGVDYLANQILALFEAEKEKWEIETFKERDRILMETIENERKVCEAEKECLGCHTLPEDNPLHTCPAEWQDEFVEWYKSYSVCPPWSSVLGYIARLLSKEKEKWAGEIEYELSKLQGRVWCEECGKKMYGMISGTDIGDYFKKNNSNEKK